MAYHQYEVYLVPLDPTIGAEMKKTRPCAIVSPDEMNDALRTVVITPLTSSRTDFVFRVPCIFDGVKGEVALDHLRSVDKRRLRKRLGQLDGPTQAKVAQMLAEIFG